MNLVKTLVPITVCIAGALLASTASQAQDAQRDCASVTSLQKRVVEHADQGMEALRSFVWTARVTHGIEMQDVKAGLDKWRAAVTCQKEVAAAAAKAQSAPQETPGQIVAETH